jgi:hypothetical protein
VGDFFLKKLNMQRLVGKWLVSPQAAPGAGLGPEVGRYTRGLVAL